jgi:protein-L-isoaspartate(D-aspartate) O-methyltransferase
MDALADRLKEPGVIRSAPVEDAFREVPRHLFAPPVFYRRVEGQLSTVEYDLDNPARDHLEIIYSGVVLVTHQEDGLATSSLSEAGLVANMLELLELGEGMRVLEIGAGSGFNAALLAAITGSQALVTTMDNQTDVVAQARAALSRAGFPYVRVVEADGFFGAPDAAPYQRIIATVGCPDLSPHWVDQLADDGAMLIPLRHGGANPLLLAKKDGDTVSGRFVGSSGFMAIRGQLYDNAYYAPPDRSGDRDGRELPLWQDLRNMQSPWDRQPFWFYIGLIDPRAHITRWWPPRYSLLDTATESSIHVDGDRIILHGDRALIDDLNKLHDNWVELGSPDITDYTVRFLPAGDPITTDLGRREWAVTGRHHTRIYSLPAP